MPGALDTHALTGMVPTASGFACPASQNGALIPTFTGGEFPLD